MSGDDGTDSRTQVPTVTHAWMPVALPYHVRHSMSLSLEDPPELLSPALKSHGHGSRRPRFILSRVMRWVYRGYTCGEILFIHLYRDEVEDRYGSLLGLIPFESVAPPLQLGEVETYLVWGV
jgi:hypothetical protein